MWAGCYCKIQVDNLNLIKSPYIYLNPESSLLSMELDGSMIYFDTEFSYNLIFFNLTFNVT